MYMTTSVKGLDTRCESVNIGAEEERSGGSYTIEAERAKQMRLLTGSIG
jgi:hypothetical protein